MSSKRSSARSISTPDSRQRAGSCGLYLESASELPLEQRAVDPKTTLQEQVQARGWPLPAYSVVEESGPDHDKVFTVEVRIRGDLVGRGIGRTKKGAEQAAAGGALAVLDSSGDLETRRRRPARRPVLRVDRP